MDWNVETRSVDRIMFFRNLGVVLSNLSPNLKNLTLHLTPNLIFERTEFERKKLKSLPFWKNEIRKDAIRSIGLPLFFVNCFDTRIFLKLFFCVPWTFGSELSYEGKGKTILKHFSDNFMAFWVELVIKWQIVSIIL
jgi:hypothetical protein